MLDPFINYPSKDSMKENETLDKNNKSQDHQRSIGTAKANTGVGLWLGSLLIKMGEKLTKGALTTKSTHEHA